MLLALRVIVGRGTTAVKEDRLVGVARITEILPWNEYRAWALQHAPDKLAFDAFYDHHLRRVDFTAYARGKDDVEMRKVKTIRLPFHPP